MEDKTASQQSISLDVEPSSTTIIVNDMAAMPGSGTDFRSVSDMALTGSSTSMLMPTPGSGAGSVSSIAGLEERPSVSGVHLLVMCMERNNQSRSVSFHEGVVDNESMNRRKSKCCCIYRKPHDFGESSSSTDDECEHCCGHPEVRARNRMKKQQNHGRRCLHSAPASVQGLVSTPAPAPAPAAAASLEGPIQDTEVAGDSNDGAKIQLASASCPSLASKAKQH